MNRNQPQVRIVAVEVDSFTFPDVTYDVTDLDQPRARCSCPQFTRRLQYQKRGECKHIRLARQQLQQADALLTDNERADFHQWIDTYKLSQPLAHEDADFAHFLKNDIECAKLAKLTA